MTEKITLAADECCGTCVFARKAVPTNFADDHLLCYRYPPTPIPHITAGKLATLGAMYPLVQRKTLSCGEYRPRVTQ